MCYGPSMASPAEAIHSLKICYWNIHGWTSKIIGNKLSDSEFLGKVSNCDIVALSELHCDKEISMVNYSPRTRDMKLCEYVIFS